MNAWTLEIDKEWIAWLVFDLPDEKVNTFTADALQDLAVHLEDLADNEAIKAIAIRSGKPDGFIAGANIDEAELFAYAREHLAPHKTPKHWITVDEFPLTGSGKIQKYVLRQRWETGAS